MTDRELVERACDGERAAMRALHDRHAPRVFAVVRRIAGDEDAARDLSQEAWVRAFRNLPAFRGEARFSTWIHRIAVNVAIEASRRNGARARREAPLPDSLPSPERSGDPLLAARLERALTHLPPGMREVLVLHDVEGWTHEEIARALGVTPGTSKSQLFKARARMRALLQGTVGPRGRAPRDPASLEPRPHEGAEA